MSFELRDQIAVLIRLAMANDPAHVISKDTRATVAERYADLVMDLISGQPIVEADQSGWVPHNGADQPVPDGAKVDIRLSATMDDGRGPEVFNERAGDWGWFHEETDPRITHYRLVRSIGDASEAGR